MKIVTWNINSVRVRLELVQRYLRDYAPDFLLLQETKCQDHDFPKAAIESLGYHCHIHGQKSYNGVAILAKSSHSVKCTRTALPDEGTDAEEEAQARYIELEITLPAPLQPRVTDGTITIGCLYAPNGNPVENTAKYANKLRWYERLTRLAELHLAADRDFLLAGDFNICPTERDLYDPIGWHDDALFRLESRQAWRKLCNLGLVDAVRMHHPIETIYSFWDYQAGRWNKGEGLRIDHLLLSPRLADRLFDAGIDATPRGWENTSDHTTAWVELSLG